MPLIVVLGLYGIIQAAVLVLLATGLVSVFSILRIPNFAQVGSYLVGGFVAYDLFEHFKIPAILGMLVSGVAGGVIGLLLWFVAFRPIRTHPRAEMFVTAFGAFIVIENVLGMSFGSLPHVYPILRSNSGSFDGIVPYDWLAIVPVAALLVGLLVLVHSKTLVGKAAYAVSQNQRAAESSGINAEAVSTITLVAGSALGGLGGALFGGLGGISSTSGTNVLLIVFAIMVVGGMGSIGGTVIAAVVLSLANAYIVYYASAYSTIAYFVAVIAVLMIRPEGLFSGRGSGHVDVA